MASTAAFRDRVLGLLLPFGPVAARGMFGGYGLFMDGTMFGLIADDALYIKFGPGTRKTFAAAGGRPFAYSRRGRTVEMSYWRVPDEVMADPARLSDWAALGLATARETPRSLAGRRRKKNSPRIP
ncbi:MAG: transcriptional regulator [Alphaproteobacteria bacterium]|nr:transcriptional regulator [Alphaproteobacteria bacterium]